MDKQGEGATIRDGATNRMNTVRSNEVCLVKLGDIRSNEVKKNDLFLHYLLLKLEI